jgi:hypothetical protein
MKNKKNTTERDTPIRDGDTRPDQNVDGLKEEKPTSPVAGKNKITKERAADVNSLEDFKDA